MNSRRHFIRCFSLCGAAVLASNETQVQAQAPMVDEKNPTAAALGYVADATRRALRDLPCPAEARAARTVAPIALTPAP
jgi:hypothetical protein